MEIFDGSVGLGTLLLLGLCLCIALAFEFVNGFHDTANAVATVIYTKSLKPNTAVIWSGLMNFLGVITSSGAVAFGIVHLLPVDLLININGTAGLLMVLSLLIAAILWNIGTWYFGLPSSSSHALIGSILGVGLASSFFSGRGFGSGVNWGKAQETGMALLLSPLVGFGCAALLLLLAKLLIRDPRLYEEPAADTPPPFWIRAILCITCTGVSFAHGSNDGQKGIGLMMLIVIGLLPTQFSINPALTTEERTKAVTSIRAAEQVMRTTSDGGKVADSLNDVAGRLERITEVKAMSDTDKKDLRAAILRADDSLGKQIKTPAAGLSGESLETLKKGRKALTNGITDFILSWIPLAVALALGIGTTIGWKRIVVTVGEKIGKTHLTYAQGASAELVAMCTIFAADHLGLPVSTTHVLSSGVAGTMAANASGLQMGTLRNIALAWILTLPVTILLAGGLFALTAGPILKQNPPPVVEPRPERTQVPMQGKVLPSDSRPVYVVGRPRTAQ